jgi:hypothetical protein
MVLVDLARAGLRHLGVLYVTPFGVIGRGEEDVVFLDVFGFPA